MTTLSGQAKPMSVQESAVERETITMGEQTSEKLSLTKELAIQPSKKLSQTRKWFWQTSTGLCRTITKARQTLLGVNQTGVYVV